MISSTEIAHVTSVFVNLRPSASSNDHKLKTKLVEHFQGYRMVVVTFLHDKCVVIVEFLNFLESSQIS